MTAGYFDDWDGFITYLNNISRTTVFNKFLGPDHRPVSGLYVDDTFNYDSETSTDPDPEIKVGPAIESITAQLLQIVSANPLFHSEDKGMGRMMEAAGWCLECTIYDPDNEDMTTEAPYIFLCCTQVGPKQNYLYGLLLSFIGTWEEPIVNSFQLVAQRYREEGGRGWMEVADEPKDWSVPNWAYIYSDTPFIKPVHNNIINFPYGAWSV